MNPLQKKLREIQGKFGQDVFLDEELLRKELRLHFSITKKDIGPTLWCVQNKVYFKAYADPSPQHMWYYHYTLLRKLEEQLGTDEAEALEAVDAWFGIANHKKEEAFQKPDAAWEPLYKELWDCEQDIGTRHEPGALEGFLHMAEQTAIARYFAGKICLYGKRRDEEQAARQFEAGAGEGNRDCVW
ncbi:hypothetical protein LJC49_11060, partial [Ruminococcaceae bacterium OttesenSCG-928-I18]|nr:hypothetical protein [Ruminococcaceae bacterium OttesenSCG-928-I18]